MITGERLFSIGLQCLILMLFLIAIFHSAFNIDARRMQRKNREIVRLEQELNNQNVRFAAMVRPEVLRPIVMRIHPNFRTIGTGQLVRIRDLN